MALPRPKSEAKIETKSSEKYATKNDDASEVYKRESSVASASNIGMDGKDRAFTPNLNRSDTSHSEMIKKNFGDFWMLIFKFVKFFKHILKHKKCKFWLKSIWQKAMNYYDYVVK